MKDPENRDEENIPSPEKGKKESEKSAEEQGFLIGLLAKENLPARLAKIESLVEKGFYVTQGQLEKGLKEVYWRIGIGGLAALGIVILRDIFSK